jgi:hypothetical protein
LLACSRTNRRSSVTKPVRRRKIRSNRARSTRRRFLPEDGPVNLEIGVDVPNELAHPLLSRAMQIGENVELRHQPFRIYPAQGMAPDIELSGMGGERLDTRSPTSKLMLTILAGVATWEREIMLERRREGIAKAKAEGRYKGRAPTVATQAKQIRSMRAAGVGPADIARQLGVARSSVYRTLEPA